MSDLSDRLGHGDDARVAIISADLLGSCHAANDAGYRALREGVATTAALAVPCPWARHAALEYRGEDVGVHLTLNSQLDTLRWGPITHAPSLLDGDGGFPRTPADLWDHADLEEVRRECRAQLERAVLWGVGVTHLTSHLHALQARPEFFDVYLELACEFDLPLRLQGGDAEHRAGFPFRTLAAAEGVVMPDRVDDRPLPEALADLQSGVTEIVTTPATDTPELRAADPHWAARAETAERLVAAETAASLHGVVLTGYRALRRLQRAG